MANKTYYDKNKKTLYQQVQKGNNYQKEEIWAELEVPYIMRDVDSDEMWLVITTDVKGKKVTKKISPDELQPQKLLKYANFGFPVLDSRNRKLICSWLLSNMPRFPAVDVTKDIGWKWSDKKPYFQLRKAISKDSDVDVRYNGDIKIGSKGDFEEYKQMLADFVLPHIEPQVIVAFSAASALATWLNPELTLVLHMDGESTTGKTTMLRLSGSVWGSTKIDTNGVVQTYSSTKNALINSLCGVIGVTLCYDELGSTDMNYENLIYLLSNGTDKKRMNEEAPKKFSVNICSSGEIPLKTIEGVNGTDARLLEFSVQWTQDAKHAGSIKAAISKCYGSLGVEFVKALLSVPMNTLKAELDELTTLITEQFTDELSKLSSKKKRIVKRAIEKVAVVSLTAKIMKEKLSLDFDYMGIADFMLTKSQLFNLPDDECIVMLELFMQHRRLQMRNGNTYTSNYKEIIKDEFICVPREDFYNTLKALGYGRKTAENNVKELNKRHIVYFEAGKPYNRHEINGKRFHFIDLNTDVMRKEGVDFE